MPRNVLIVDAASADLQNLERIVAAAGFLALTASSGQRADMAWGPMPGARGHVAKPYSRAQIVAQLNA